MISPCKKVVIMILLLINILATPVGMYFIFRDFYIQSSIYIWIQNIVTAIFAFFFSCCYLYALKWFALICYPVSQDTIDDDGDFLIAPVSYLSFIALLQGKWIVLGISFGCAVFCFCVVQLLQRQNEVEPQESQSPSVHVVPVAQRPTFLNVVPYARQSSSSDDENKPLVVVTRVTQITRIVHYTE